MKRTEQTLTWVFTVLMFIGLTSHEAQPQPFSPQTQVTLTSDVNREVSFQFKSLRNKNRRKIDKEVSRATKYSGMMQKQSTV